MIMNTIIYALLLSGYAALATKSSPDKSRDLIIGGSIAPINAYPWFAMAHTSDDKWDKCGGSLVTPEYVLTSADCVSNTLAKYRIGALCPYKVDNCGQASQSVNVAKKYVHAGFNSITLEKNFALVKLASRVNVTNPVNMDQGDIAPTFFPGWNNLWALGFGKTDNTDDDYYPTTNLFHVELKYVSQVTCAAMYPEYIFPSTMCATDSGQGFRRGDWGGPLYDSDLETLVGVASWYSITKPSIFSRIADQWTWIKTTICADHSSPKPDFCVAKALTSRPSLKPSTRRTRRPTRKPTSKPTTKPTTKPISKATAKPSRRPTRRPTRNPTLLRPTVHTKPTAKPASKTSSKPTTKPSSKPSSKPTAKPIAKSSSKPTAQPSSKQLSKPSAKPIAKPSSLQTQRPSSKPTSFKTPTTKPTTISSFRASTKRKPTFKPTANPMVKPPILPSMGPRSSSEPTAKPTTIPSFRASTKRKPTFKPTANIMVKSSIISTKGPGIGIGVVLGFLVISFMGLWTMKRCRVLRS